MWVSTMSVTSAGSRPSARIRATAVSAGSSAGPTSAPERLAEPLRVGEIAGAEAGVDEEQAFGPFDQQAVRDHRRAQQWTERWRS